MSAIEKIIKRLEENNNQPSIEINRKVEILWEMVLALTEKVEELETLNRKNYFVVEEDKKE
jgi:hypothetical protein